MSGAQRLKRVFNIDIETCNDCGGTVKVIACIEDPLVIENILAHLQQREQEASEALAQFALLQQSRAPPWAGLFDCF